MIIIITNFVINEIFAKGVMFSIEQAREDNEVQKENEGGVFDFSKFRIR